MTTTAGSAKLGAEFKAELVYTDNGVQRYEGHSPAPSSTFDVNKTRIILTGKINPATDYRFKFNLLSPSASPLHYGYGTYNFTLADLGMGLSIGKMKVQQGGWDQKLNEFSDHVQGYYNRNFAFKSYEPMLALSVAAAGIATIQLVNDLTTDNSGQWNQKEHLTFILGWYGDLGTINPVLTYGSYDNNKSNWVDLGVQLEAGALTSRLDLKLDTISNKIEIDGQANSKEDKASSLTFKVAYEIKSLMTPWVYYSSYDKKQYEDAAASKKDAKVNNGQVGADGTYVYALDDNAIILGAGADFALTGYFWMPYFAVTATSARFAPLNQPAKAETRYSGTVHLGCYGSI